MEQAIDALAAQTKDMNNLQNQHHTLQVLAALHVLQAVLSCLYPAPTGKHTALMLPGMHATLYLKHTTVLIASYLCTLASLQLGTVAVLSFMGLGRLVGLRCLVGRGHLVGLGRLVGLGTLCMAAWMSFTRLCNPEMQCHQHEHG